MVEHFENIDLDRIEFELPFFDANFIAEIVLQPVDRFLRHVFYLDWLGQFDSKVLEIPWQAYPGHVPCPLPKPENLEYQWESTQEDRKQAIDLALQFADSFSQNQEFMTNYITNFTLNYGNYYCNGANLINHISFDFLRFYIDIGLRSNRSTSCSR